MKIIIDAMGGDNAPREIVRGVCEASELTEAKLVLVGKEAEISPLLDEFGADRTKLELVEADEAITMDDPPMCVVRGKKNSSMAVGLRMLKEDGDAFVSAGSTGALHVGASLIVRNIPGVRCAAIATILPFDKPMLLMDCGANVNVKPEYLLQWAHTGSVYMKNVMNVENPRVGLLNNGTEECKGTSLQVEAYKLLAEAEGINFCGNVEGKEIPFGACDVLITDGFTGNIALKTVEGMSRFMLKSLKSMFGESLRTKLAAALMMSSLKAFKKKYDTKEVGGAPILGISKPVIKAHGSSDAREIRNAILQAERFAASGTVEAVTAALAKKTAE